MKKSLLVTSGCSWTFGVGAGFQHGMTKEQYHQIAWDTNISDQLSFRGILSNKYGLDNINWAQAKPVLKYLTGPRFEHDQMYVLWYNDRSTLTRR